MSLFQEEPDEESSPSPFQNEGDEKSFLFQDEADEGEQTSHPSLPRPSRSLQVLGDEADEPVHLDRSFGSLFDDEEDEDDSDSNGSACLADCEHDCSNDQQQLVQQVDLSFFNLNKFLSTKLGFQQASQQEPPKKKRCYNNDRRAAQAAAKRKLRGKDCSGRKPLPRNNPET